jgi:sialate O-acetylesterase
MGKKEFTERLRQYEKWLPKAKAALANNEYPEPAPKLPTMLGSWKTREATRIYNGMIHSLHPYAVKGALWYQGEANMGHNIALYPAKKKALIDSWRQLFESGDFPFYFVQLAGFQVSRNTPAGGDGFAPMREAQKQSLEIPNTGMALAIDVGNPHDIHPKNKQDVGKRLAQLALHYDYGKSIAPCGPLYKSINIKDGQAIISFDHVGKGLMAAHKEGLNNPQPQSSKELAHFAIAGADKVWHWAKATIHGDKVIVSSPQVKEPVAVRFAYTATPAKFNFYNKEGLPASPFKTDNW